MGSGPHYPRRLIEPFALEAISSTGTILCGSLRRGCVMVGDIDLVLPGGSGTERALESLRSIGWTVVDRGRPRTRLVRPFKSSPLELDLWTADDEALGACVMHATGCGMLNTVMRRWGFMHGMRLSWRGVQRMTDGVWLGRATEEECCAALGWPCMPPEDREEFLCWAQPFLDEMNSKE